MRGFTLVEILIVVAILGILAAIAIPNFSRFQARSKQAEARTNLKAIHQAQVSYFAEKDTFSANLNHVGFLPERGNRYAYMMQLAPANWQSRLTANNPALAADVQGIEVDCFKFYGGPCPALTPAQPAREAGAAVPAVTYDPGKAGPADTGVTLGSNGGYVAEARGTIDHDYQADVWLVASGSITVAPANQCYPQQTGAAGIPVLIYNDVACP